MTARIDRVLRAAMLLAALLAPAARAATPYEQQVLAALNAMRADPDAYAADLLHYRRYYRGRILRLPDGKPPFVTREGVAPLMLAVPFLRAQPVLASLEPSGLLEEAARDHVAAQAASGNVGHYQRGGIGPSQRVQELGGGGAIAEVIAYGPRDPGEMIRQLVIDDGVPDRGHRRILFDRALRFAGVACGPHRRFRTMCVIDLSPSWNGGGVRSPDQWLRTRAARFADAVRGAITPRR